MRVRVFDTSTTLARAAARAIARALAATPGMVLGLPTGSTPIPLYAELVRLHQLGRASFRSATTFNLDEFFGVAPADPRSYRTFMQQHLFNHVDIASRRVHFLDGRVRSRRAIQDECERYERSIAKAGGIDLQILGLGTNGHIGFNEPGNSLVARTHCTRLTPATRRANALLFGNRAAAVPREALSMGIATILHARRIVLLATGSAKARCVERMIRGPVTPRLPASLLQLHQNVDVWLDEAAARNLEL